jgi:murein DD-endopeptidase MepM/ murein hydrolase activator NlpD
MQKIKDLLKKAFTPITIMFIPHSNSRSYRLKVPSVGILVSFIFLVIGCIYVFTVTLGALEYNRTKEKLDYYMGQFLELKSAIVTLKETENEFKKLFSLGSKEEILENFDTSDSGSLDLENLKEQIKVTMETAGEIKDYLSEQRDIYLSTPVGWPVKGYISSPFGKRTHPKTGKRDFHGGIDIAAGPGNPVRATADGIVSFAGWSGNNGNLVVLEHGFGYSTFYAHNRKVLVKTGQKVKRGDTIGYVGSTGNSTGPHVHYEIWRDGKHVNPYKFLQGRS